MISFLKDYARLHPAELAGLLEACPPEEVAALVTAETAADLSPVLGMLSPGAGSTLLGRLAPALAGELLAALDPSRAAVLLAGLDEATREQALAVMPPQAATELRELMSYPPGSAGALMSSRLATYPPTATAGDVLSHLRSAGNRSADLLLVDRDGRFSGLVSVAVVATADPTVPVSSLVEADTVAVQAMAPRDEVVETMTRAGARTLPVVDVEGRLVGVLRHTALIKAAEASAATDMVTMVGAGGEERALSPVTFAVRKRLPWLQINLLTAFLAASVVGVFEATIAQVTALAVLLPVVAGQSGNTGAQALAVTMRGLALREIRARQWVRVTVKEATVGLINGVGVAATTMLGVYLWSGSVGLALVIGSSMIISMLAAGLAGAAVPIGLSALKQDPAQSSSIVLTTVTDIVGFFSFLGIATLLMDML